MLQYHFTTTDGTVLDSANLDMITNESFTQYMYTIDKTAIDFGENEHKTYYFTITTTESDWNEVDNQKLYVVSKDEMEETNPDGEMEEIVIVMPESVEIVEENVTLNGVDAESIQLNANIYPSNASIQYKEWSSDNYDVVYVDSQGNITPTGIGTATITVTVLDGITDTITVTVTEKTEEDDDSGDEEEPEQPEEIILPFTDVKETSWYYGTVKEIYRYGLMTGTTATTFAPTAPMTRAMATVVLYRMSGSPKVAFETIFKDVVDGRYYSSAVTWASQNNVINGYAVDNTFRPGQNVSREQMAVILYNYVKSLGLDMSASKDLSTFGDGDKVATYAKTAMSWAVGSGLLSGTKEGNLEPKEEASRAECAKMLLKVYEIVQEKQ